MLTSLIILVTGGLSVFFLIGRALTEYRPNDLERIRLIERNVYIDIAIAAGCTAFFGFSTITLTVYQYLSFKFLILSILNYERMLEVKAD